MSRFLIDRRRFLTLPLALLFAPVARVYAEIEPRKGEYAADVGILYKALSFHVNGTMDESIDRTNGRYDVTIAGQGTSIANRIESRGLLWGGRWAPLHSVAWFEVAGREARSEITYDYDRRMVEYHYRGETFLLRRLRVAEDVLHLPENDHVDDVISAILNYADQKWPAEPDGIYRTQIVRRHRDPKEGPDDVQKLYHAELVPFVLKIASDLEAGKPTALFDLTRFSSWAREDRPARVVFGPDRRPEMISSWLILGTSVTIRLSTVS